MWRTLATLTLAGLWLASTAWAQETLQGSGLDVPKTHAIDATAWANDRDAELAKVAESPGYPCVVKPAREGCSTALAVIEAQVAADVRGGLDQQAGVQKLPVVVHLDFVFAASRRKNADAVDPVGTAVREVICRIGEDPKRPDAR